MIPTLGLALVLAFAVPQDVAPRVAVLRAPHAGFQPCAAVGGDGALHVVAHTGDAKSADLVYARSTDGGKTFGAPLAITTASTRACAFGAVRGAQLALGRGGRVHVAWNGPGGADPHRAPLLYSRLDEKGERFEPARDVITRYHGLDGGGALVADPAGRVWVLWHAPEVEGGGEETRRVFMVRSDDDGKTFGAETAVSPNGSGVCPCCGMAAFASGDGIGAVYRIARGGEKRDTLYFSVGEGSAGYNVLDKWKASACVMSTYAVASGADGPLVAFESNGAIRYTRPTARPDAAVTAPGDSKARKHPALACNAKGDVLLAWISGANPAEGGTLEWQVFGADGKPLAGAAGSRDDVPVWDLPAAVALSDGSFVLLY